MLSHKRLMYRAVSFGRAIGPWRDCREKARRDLIDADLGSYSEWGTFFITVPGDIQTKPKVPIQSEATAVPDHTAVHGELPATDEHLLVRRIA